MVFKFLLLLTWLCIECAPGLQGPDTHRCAALSRQDTAPTPTRNQGEHLLPPQKQACLQFLSKPIASLLGVIVLPRVLIHFFPREVWRPHIAETHAEVHGLEWCPYETQTPDKTGIILANTSHTRGGQTCSLERRSGAGRSGCACPLGC